MKKLKENNSKLFHLLLSIVCVIIFFSFIILSNPNSNKANNTICYFEYNEKEDEGMVSRINYNAFFSKNNNVYEEDLTKYTFENDKFALKYYQNHIEELKEYGNEVHLINNIMTIYNIKKLDTDKLEAAVSLYKGLDSKCSKNDSSMLKKYNNIKKKFQKEKSKSDKYIKNINESSKEEKQKSEKESKYKPSTSNSSYNTTTASTATDYLSLLKKCTVMEAADLYNTGGGQTGENVFDKGRKTCETWYKHEDEQEFIKAVNLDWNNRKNEKVDGKPLSYYLDTLEW